MHISPNEKSQFDERVFRFAEPHEAALVAWRKPTQSFGDGRVSKAELTRLLIRETGRPIVLFGALLRIVKMNEREYMWFEEATTLESQLKLFLEVTPEQVRQVD